MTLCLLPTGLILADSINMLLRIAFSLVYVHSLCGASTGVRLTAFLPSPGTLTALSAAFLVTGVVCCSGACCPGCTVNAVVTFSTGLLASSC